MRFDEYLAQHRISAVPVDRYDGYAVEVVLPEDWYPLEADPGIRIWAWADDPNIATFCANAVLTMHRVDAALDPAEVFAMLCDQQLHMLPDSSERRRTLAQAIEGPGAAGVLEMRIGSDSGILASESRTRILTTGQQTLIAQLTLTALPSSAVDRAGIWLTLTTAALAGQAPVGYTPPRRQARD